MTKAIIAVLLVSVCAVMLAVCAAAGRADKIIEKCWGKRTGSEGGGTP